MAGLTGGALTSFGDRSGIARLVETPELGRANLDGDGFRAGADSRLRLANSMELGASAETIFAGGRNAGAAKLSAQWRF